MPILSRRLSQQDGKSIHRTLLIDRFQSTRDIPPINRIVATTSRNVTGSLKISTPPMAAIAGTESWTLAARVALNRGNA